MIQPHFQQTNTPFTLVANLKNYRRSWNCCDWQTCFVVIWKQFCFILSMGTKIRIDSVMRPRSSSRGGAIQVSQLQLQLHPIYHCLHSEQEKMTAFLATNQLVTLQVICCYNNHS